MDIPPPKTIPEILANIGFEEALRPTDSRYVDTHKARGSEQTFRLLAAKFNFFPSRNNLFLPLNKVHVLFFGHTGSGKTTVLRDYVSKFTGKALFFPVEVDITDELDRNNLRYPDVLMAMARKLIDALGTAQVSVDAGVIASMEAWFKDHVLTQAVTKDWGATLETSAEAKAGIPFIASLLAKFTAGFKTNVTDKDELRSIVRKSFTQFAAIFNAFLRSAETALQRAGKGRRILFVVDGADKIPGDHTRAFFVEDAELLLAIEANAVYTAPLSLSYEGYLPPKLERLTLPMIKLYDRDGQRFEAGYSAMRDILLRRADPSVFKSDSEIQQLVEHSGGHPRELLRLFKLCCEVADDQIDASVVSDAVRMLAADYRRFLEPDDFHILVSADRDNEHLGNDARTRTLLYNLSLLEYNDGSWRRSHPVVRTLEGYVRAMSAPATAPAAVPPPTTGA
jgi:hypothetical protein